MIEEILIGKIASIKINSPRIVAICGAADLGKSYLANQITQLLNEKNLRTSHLPLDSFLLDRNERKSEGLSGYQIESHRIDQVLETLKDWKQGQPINFRPYDHEGGEKGKYYESIVPSEVLIIEGLFSIHELLLPYIDYSIFIYTSDQHLKQLKLEADLVKRNYTSTFSKEIYDYEFGLYKSNIEPYKEIADCRLYLKEKWIYKLEEK